jgi:GntR family transcriptional repressor for pyruvate dehydrogenase complex
VAEAGRQRRSLVEDVAERLLEDILDGTIPAGGALPTEMEIAGASAVSRLTAREAIRTLLAHNIVHVRRGRGTFVNPQEEWTDLGSIFRAVARDLTRKEIPLRLLEVRRIVETGAAELAATHRSASDLVAMGRTIADMAAARDRGDVDAFSDADIAFHDAVLRASGNPFVPALLVQLTSLLRTMRRATSAFDSVQEHALEHHRSVRAAISGGDPGEARLAMDLHISQTYSDYERYMASGSDAD